jgi:hypothetical protein
LNCRREHDTKAEKEKKKVPGATATAMASKATNKHSVCGEFEKSSQRSGIFWGREQIRAVG